MDDLPIVVSNWSACSHPRIIFTAEEKNRMYNRLQKGETASSGIDVDEAWSEYLAKGEQFVTETGFEVLYPSVKMVMQVDFPIAEPQPLSQPHGFIDFPFWTMFSRAIEERLVHLAVLYAFTGGAKYADKARDHMISVAGFHKWYEFDHRGAEGNLSNAHFLIGMATAYDMLYNYLDEKDREYIQTALLEKGLNPLAIDFGNRDQHNIIVAKQVAMMIGALALLGDLQEVELYIKHSYDYLLTYLNGRVLAEETEGLMYNNIAAKHIAQAGVALRKTTGDDSISSHPFLTEIVPEQFFYFLSAGVQPSFANFSDAFHHLDVSYLMSMLAEQASNGAAMWFVQRYDALKPSVLLNLSEGTQAIHPNDYFGVKKSKVFPRIGWASLRTGWNEQDHFIGFTSSPSSRDHNHYDQNHFILNAAGEWLITDPGYQDYRPGPIHEVTVHTLGHNSMLVNGQGQSKRGGGKLTEWFLTKPLGYVEGDATDSYGGAVKQWNRTVMLVSESYYIVVDDIEAGDSRDEIDLLFHTKGRVKDSEGKVLLLNEDEAQLPVLFEGENAAVRLYPISGAPMKVNLLQYPGAEDYGTYLSIRPQATEGKKSWLATLLVPHVNKADLQLENDPAVTGGEADGIRWIVVERGQHKELICLPSDLSDLAPSFLEINDIRFKGKLAAVSILVTDQSMSACSLIKGTTLDYGGRRYIDSDCCCNASIQYMNNEIVVNLVMSELTTVKISAPQHYASSGSWESDQSTISWRVEGDLIIIAAPQGECHLTFKIV